MKSISFKTLVLASLSLILFACGVGEIADPNEYPVTLSDAEKQHPLATYYHQVAKPSDDHYASLVQYAPSDGLPFSEIGEMLEPGYLALENGYTRFEDGSGYVAVNIQFPKSTGAMIDWWFDWVGYDVMRYKIWYPGLHAISLFEEYEEPETYSISKYVLEHPEGKTCHTVETLIRDEPLQDLQIIFVNPSQYGLDLSKLGENQWAVCANVKSGKHTIVQMVHFVRNTENGIEMRSRFWVGNELPKAARKIAISEDQLYDLAHHCLSEYTQLASFLPEVYGKYSSQN